MHVSKRVRDLQKTTTPLRSSGNDSANGDDSMAHINTGRDADNGTSDPQSSQSNFSHRLLVETHSRKLSHHVQVDGKSMGNTSCMCAVYRVLNDPCTARLFLGPFNGARNDFMTFYFSQLFRRKQQKHSLTFPYLVSRDQIQCRMHRKSTLFVIKNVIYWNKSSCKQSNDFHNLLEISYEYNKVLYNRRHYARRSKI